MIRIAHIANMYGPKSGGLRTVMNELGREYARKGHPVLLVVPGPTDSLNIEGLITRVTVAAPRVPFSGGYRVILKTHKVVGHLVDFRPDVIEVSDRTTLLKVARWASQERIPSTFFAHERVDGIVRSFARFLPFQKALVQYWNKLTRDSVGRIVATTNFAAEEFHQIGLAIDDKPKSKLVLVPLGVDLEKFDSDICQEKITSPTWPDQYVLACTRLSKEKDPYFLLEIARELRNRRIQTPIVIAGSGPLELKIRRIVEREELNVHLLGFISEQNALSALMSGATSFLAVGPIETFGLAALETLASGTPVICRFEAAISEIINADSGRALPRSQSAWVDAICEFERLDRAETRLKTRAHAEKFTWKETADHLLQFYRWDVAT
ncbi:MAG: glycosyltransferase [Actinobacteria bacterium]|nr:glycosyltransferase [Actinomycetota bacterium]MDA2984329.1 glycosyltransferase [Actinomycetota bacterium]